MISDQRQARSQVQGATVLYGGAFDPPHLGHQMACLYLLEGLGAEAVWLLPTFTHPLKTNLAPYASRVRMCEALAQPFSGRVVVSEAEREAGPHGYTYDVVRYVRRRDSARRFVLALGSDLLTQTPRWHRFSELAQDIPIVVIGRQGYPHPDPEVFSLPDIRSSTIREDWCQGRSIAGHLPRSVYALIKAEGHYPNGQQL